MWNDDDDGDDDDDDGDGDDDDDDGGDDDEVEEALKGVEGMAAAIISAQAKIALDKPRSAVTVLQDALEETREGDPLFLKGLWELARAYTLQQKVRSATRTLDELEDIDPNYRKSEIEAWRVGLRLLQ